MEITLYHTPDVEFRGWPEAQPPPPGGSVLADFVAAMAPGTWARAPDAANADVATASPGSVGNIITNFANSTAYDPIRKRIPIVGGAHGVLPKHVTLDLIPHSWSVLLDPSLGTHPFQHVTVDPATGDTYLMAPMPAGTSTSSFNLFRWNDAGKWDDLGPMAEAAATYSALAWWNGKLTWYTGNGAHKVYQRDAASGIWTLVANESNGNCGVYHSESVPTPDGLVYGGGNDSAGNYVQAQQLRLLAPDLTVTRMPDAPFKVGVAHGMITSGDGKGRVNLLGFGQFWRLHPAVRTMARLPDPPAELLQPGDPPGTMSIMACAIDELECAAYIQWEAARTPHTSVWVNKAA